MKMQMNKKVPFDCLFKEDIFLGEKTFETSKVNHLYYIYVLQRRSLHFFLIRKDKLNQSIIFSSNGWHLAF